MHMAVVPVVLYRFVFLLRSVRILINIIFCSYVLRSNLTIVYFSSSQAAVDDVSLTACGEVESESAKRVEAAHDCSPPRRAVRHHPRQLPGS